MDRWWRLSVWKRILCRPNRCENFGAGEKKAVCNTGSKKELFMGELSIEALLEENRRLKEENELFRTLVDHSSDVIWLMDMNMKTRYMSPSVREQLGYTPEEYLSMSLEERLPPESMKETQKILAMAMEKLKQGEKDFPLRYEMQHRHKNGKLIWGEVNFSVLFDSEGKPQWIHGVTRSIQDRKEMEEALRKTIVEKEDLLHEVHHRVKNNMNIISSLLGLQMRYLSDPKSIEVLQESRSRVNSLMMVYQYLDKEKNTESIDLNRYFRDLASSLFATSGLYGSKVRLDVETPTDPIELDVKQAIYCGLIVNEVLSNAFQHAFPDGRGGEVKVWVKQEGQKIGFGVRDDGVGIPEEATRGEPQTLGLQIIRMLVGQIGARQTVERSLGTSVEFWLERKS